MSCSVCCLLGQSSREYHTCCWDAVGDFRPSPCDCSCCGLSSVSPSNSTRVFPVLLGGFIRSSCQEMWVSAGAEGCVLLVLLLVVLY